MPGSSRFLIIAVSSLLVSSALAGLIHPRDVESMDHSIMGSKYQSTLDSTLNPAPEGARFQRFKRQEQITVDEGTVVAQEEPVPADETTVEIAESTKTMSDTSGTLASTSDKSPDTSADLLRNIPPPNGEMAGSDVPLPGQEPPKTDAPLEGEPDSRVPMISDGTGDPKVEASIAQDFIIKSRDEVEGEDKELTQEELDAMAKAVASISEDYASRPDPATVNVDEQVKTQMDEYDKLPDDEKRALHERSLYTGATQGLELNAVVGNLLGVAESIINGDVKSNATEGLEPIASEDVPTNSTDTGTQPDAGESGSSLRRRALQKRFIGFGIGALLNVMGISADLSVNAGVKTPVGSYAVGLSAAIGSATNSDQPKPQERIVFVERPSAPEPPQTLSQLSRSYNQPFPQQQQQAFPVTRFSSQEPQATVPGWDNTPQQQQPAFPVTDYWSQQQQQQAAPGWDSTYQQNQGGFGSRQNWRKFRQRLKK